MDENQRIRKARRDAGLSQEELAKAIHVATKTVSRWELGHQTPPLEALRSIARTCEVTLGYLIGEQAA